MAYRTAVSLPNYTLHLGCKVRIISVQEKLFALPKTNDVGKIVSRGYYPEGWTHAGEPCGWFVKVPWKFSMHFFDDELIIVD
jgi:hypothetical protein